MGKSPQTIRTAAEGTIIATSSLESKFDLDVLPARPVSLRSTGWSLDEFHAARLEHSRDIYRLYRYGKQARGVFRGGMLVLESIPKEDEATCFAGFLLS